MSEESHHPSIDPDDRPDDETTERAEADEADRESADESEALPRDEAGDEEASRDEAHAVDDGVDAGDEVWASDTAEESDQAVDSQGDEPDMPGELKDETDETAEDSDGSAGDGDDDPDGLADDGDDDSDEPEEDTEDDSDDLSDEGDDDPDEPAEGNGDRTWSDEGWADDSEQPHDSEWSAANEGDALWSDASPTAASGGDPWIRLLLSTALSLVVVLLVTTLALYFYMAALNHAPRTAAEHSIAKAEAAAVEQPKSIGTWRDLAYAYAGAKRFDEALATAAKGEKLDGGETLATVRGDIMRMQGRNEQAIKAYDVAEVKVKQLMERAAKERAKVGVFKKIDNDLLFPVYYGRAISELAVGDRKAALKDYELAAKEDPYESDVWVALGQLYEKAGNIDKARTSYKEALRFVDSKPALQGLKRVGEGE